MRKIHSVDDSALIQYKMIRYWVDAGRLHPFQTVKNKRKILTG